MLPIVVNATDCLIVPYGPNTDAPIRLGVTVPVLEQRGKTGVSSRRPQGMTLRCSMEWTAVITPPAYAAARNASQGAQDEPILIPAWIFARPIAAALPATSSLTLAWTRDWSSYAVNPVSLDGYDFHAPALYGRFTGPVAMTGKNGAHVQAEFSFEEDGLAAYALTPPAVVDATFATPGGYAAPVFPWAHVPDSAPLPGLAVTEVERITTGPGRIKSSIFYPQTPERVQEATFKFRGSDAIAQVLGWWQRRAGIADSHWVATTQQVGRLAAAAAAGDGSLSLADAPALGENTVFALSRPGVQELVRVTDNTADPLPLAAILANAWAPASTVVTLAMLARHTNQELAIDCRRAGDDWLGTTRISWREVAPEFDPPAGETRGETMGRLSGEAWFFQIDLDYHGAVQSWYFTNWESGATANLINWQYNDCNFDLLLESLGGEDDSCQCTFAYFPGGPWDNWLPGDLAASGILTIYRADVSAAGAFTNFETVLQGKLKSPKAKGSIVTWNANGSNQLFGRKGPRELMGKSCRTMLFRSRCGLALEDWTFAGQITSVDGNVVTVDTITRTNGGALPDGFGATDWFALGWLQWPVAGAPFRDGILGSAAIDGGEIELTLERPCSLAVGSAVTLVPGCDRIRDSGCTKFDNLDNFRGFDLIPAVNPSFIMPTRKAAAAKK